jgi:hypothetical protein
VREPEGRSIKARVYEQSSPGGALPQVIGLEASSWRVPAQQQRRKAMTKEHSFVAGDYSDRDLYTSSRTRERALNSAIVQADINESFEEYLEIFDAFYADDIEASSETREEPIRGKGRVRSLLTNFLVPLHVMAEVGGLSISICQTTIPGDIADETHSAWTLDLVGVGRTCTVTWRTLRKWRDSLVVYEHHYDEQENGGPLTSDDLSFDTAKLS